MFAVVVTMAEVEPVAAAVVATQKMLAGKEVLVEQLLAAFHH